MAFRQPARQERLNLLFIARIQPINRLLQPQVSLGSLDELTVDLVEGLLGAPGRDDPS